MAKEHIHGGEVPDEFTRLTELGTATFGLVRDAMLAHYPEESIETLRELYEAGDTFAGQELAALGALPLQVPVEPVVPRSPEVNTYQQQMAGETATASHVDFQSTPVNAPSIADDAMAQMQQPVDEVFAHDSLAQAQQSVDEILDPMAQAQRLVDQAFTGNEVHRA